MRISIHFYHPPPYFVLASVVNSKCAKMPVPASNGRQSIWSPPIQNPRIGRRKIVSCVCSFFSRCQHSRRRHRTSIFCSFTHIRTYHTLPVFSGLFFGKVHTTVCVNRNKKKAREKIPGPIFRVIFVVAILIFFWRFLIRQHKPGAISPLANF